MPERPKNPRWRSERNPQRVWKAARDKVAAEGRCRRCLSTRQLEAAHIIPRSRVNAQKGAEDPRNILPLCHDCHMAHDHGRAFSLHPYLTTEEWEYAVELVGAGEAERRLTPCAFGCLCSRHQIDREAA